MQEQGLLIDNAWEDPSPIDYSFNPIRKHKPSEQRRLSRKIWTGNRFVDILVNNYIGVEWFFKVDRKTQKVLLEEANRIFKMDLIKKHGSLLNYWRDWLKRNGFRTDNEYRNIMARMRGFKNRYDLFKFNSKKKGFRTYHQQILYNYKKRGFKNQTEYRKWLCKKRGVANCRELTELNKRLKKYERLPSPKSIPIL